jgi:hypothetical protein
VVGDEIHDSLSALKITGWNGNLKKSRSRYRAPLQGVLSGCLKK